MPIVNITTYRYGIIIATAASELHFWDLSL